MHTQDVQRESQGKTKGAAHLRECQNVAEAGVPGIEVSKLVALGSQHRHQPTTREAANPKLHDSCTSFLISYLAAMGNQHRHAQATHQIIGMSENTDKSVCAPAQVPGCG
jgi:hypothetical protein